MFDPRQLFLMFRSQDDPKLLSYWDPDAVIAWIHQRIESRLADLEQIDCRSDQQRLEYIREIDQLHQMARIVVRSSPQYLPPPSSPTEAVQTWVYMTDALFLRKCQEHLFQGATEWLLAITGPRAGKNVVLDRMIPMDSYATQTAGRATASGDAVYQVLNELNEYGMALNGVLHSHLMRGVQHPSSIDHALAARLDRGGYSTIQCIFSQDGFLTWFAGQQSFQIEITGKGIQRVNATTFQLC